MKSAAYASLLALAITLSGCGSSYNNTNGGSNPNGTSQLKNRAFVANSLQTIIGAGGGIQILDAQHDLFTTFTVQGVTGITPESLTVIPGTVPCRSNVNDTCGLGVTFSTSNNTLYVFDPTAESSLGSVVLPGPIGNFVISPDYRFVYAAVPQLGEVLTIDISGFSLFPTVSVVGAHYVALSPDGSSLMIVNDSTSVITVMNTSTRATYTIPYTGHAIDHPVAAFFLDNGNAAVLNCGAECGGTQASIASISLAQQQVVSTTNLDGATTGLLINNQLFVAGNCIASPCTSQLGGELSIASLTDTGSTVSAVVPITGGYHQFITMADSNELFVGSIGVPSAGQCANPSGSNNPGGCLSIVNIVSHQVFTDTPNGDATSVAQIPHRTVVYATEGGRLLIYDTSTMAPYTTTQVIPVTGFLTAVQAGN